jgi:hypothetical protein
MVKDNTSKDLSKLIGTGLLMKINKTGFLPYCRKEKK